MRNTLQPRPEGRPVVMAQVEARDVAEAEAWRARAREAGYMTFRAYVHALVRADAEKRAAK